MNSVRRIEFESQSLADGQRLLANAAPMTGFLLHPSWSLLNEFEP